MTSFTPYVTDFVGSSAFCKRLRTVFRLAILFVCACNFVHAAEPIKKSFDLPADGIEKSLKRFSEQSGLEVLFPTDAVAGARTQLVRGEMTAREALDGMLAGTGFAVIQDPKTGALTVKKDSDPNAPRAAQTSDRPVNPNPNDVRTKTAEEIVQLERFNVTTSVGAYAEQNTSAGSKIPTPVKELPFSVDIVNASSIADHVAKTLDDIYPYIVGMTREVPIVNTGFTIRGFTSTGQGTLQSLQVDNLPGATTRFGSPTTVNAERIEVIKGPTSVLYGQLTPGGLVNVVTKRPKASRETNYTASISSYSTGLSPLGDDLSVRGTIDTTGPIDSEKHWLYRVIVDADDLSSYRRYSSAHNYYIFPALTYRWDKATSLTVQLELANEKRHTDDYLDAPPLLKPANLPSIDTAYQEKTDVDRDWGEAATTSFQHLFDNGWKLSAAARDVTHDDTRFGFTTGNAANEVITNPIANSLINRYYQHRYIVRGYHFVDANIYGDVGRDTFRHTLLFGVNGGYERRDTNSFTKGTGKDLLSAISYYQPILGVTPYPVPPFLPADTADTKVHTNSLGAYFSDRIKVAARWNAVLGLRYDHYHQDSIEVYSRDSHTSRVGSTLPQAGFLYEATSNVSLYASYSRSFKPVAVDGSTVTPDGTHNFSPETGHQIEVGLKSEFMDRKLTATLAAYDIKKQNVLAATGARTPNGLAIAITIGEQESKGVELETIWLPVPNWQIQAGGTYLDARTTKAPNNPALVGVPFVNVPHHSGNLWTRYNFPGGPLKGFGAGLGIVHLGARLGGTTPTLSYVLPGYMRADTAFYYRWGRYNFALNISNFFDRKYVASTGENSVFPGEPRKVTLTADVRF